MDILTYLLLAILIYLALVTPFVLGIFFIIAILKLVNINEISSWDIIKSLLFLLVISFVLLPVFFYFAVTPFYNFVHYYNNPYVNLFILLIFLGVIFFFVFVHFRIFRLYVDKFYFLTSVWKDLIIYLSHVSILLFLVYFYTAVLEKVSLLM